MPTLFLAVLAVYAILAGPALGQGMCADRDAILAALGRDYGERPALRAIDAGGRVVEIIVSPSGSWSMLITRPGGPTCLGGSGEAFEFTPRATIQPGKPS